MFRRVLIAAGLCVLMILPAGASAAPPAQTVAPAPPQAPAMIPPATTPVPMLDAGPPLAADPSQISNKIQAATRSISRWKAELARRIKAQPKLVIRAKKAKKQSVRLNTERRRLSLVARKRQRELNKATSDYITLVTQIGQRNETEGQTTLTYIAGNSNDVVLVSTQSQLLVDRQDELMEKVRAAAKRASTANRALKALVARQNNMVEGASLDASTNLAAIAALRGKISRGKATLTSLKAELAQASAGQGGVVTPNQVRFAVRMAALTGLDVNVIQAWALAEESGSYAQSREREGNNNWLNIGYYDSLHGSGAFQDGYSVWDSPENGAAASAAFLTGKFLGASKGIQKIPFTAGQSIDAQINAIANSGWASSAYGGGSSIRGTYKLVPKLSQPSPLQTVFINPKNGAAIVLRPLG